MFNRINERQTVIDTFKEEEKNQTSQDSDDSQENISPSQEETDSDANYIYKLNYIKKHYLEKIYMNNSLLKTTHINMILTFGMISYKKIFH